MLERVREVISEQRFIRALAMSAAVVVVILVSYLARDLLQNAIPDAWGFIWAGAGRYVLLLILPTFLGLLVSYSVLPIARDSTLPSVLKTSVVVAIVPSLFAAAASAIDMLITVSAQQSGQQLGGFAVDVPTMFFSTLLSGLGYYFTLVIYVILISILTWLWMRESDREEPDAP